MASYFKLILEERKNMGGSSARGLRRNGKIPVNYYYKDQDNQSLREMLDKQFEAIQEEGDKILLKEGIDLMRSMHQRRKVSDLIGMLQQQEG